VICHEPTVDGRLFCRVCGEGAETWIRQGPETGRCLKHQGRHACAIEGCSRSKRAEPRETVSNDVWICAEHWRRYFPPRSRPRRAYHSIFREVKRRGGWDSQMRTRYWRFWATLVGSARARHAAGTLDVTEINRIMGWD
jgi:hypothetical protein